LDLAELVSMGEVRKAEPDAKMAQRLLDSADRWIAAAQDSEKAGHFEAALALAYNAMLNAGRAFLAAKGFRTASETQHKAVVAFCSAVLPKDAMALATAFNKYRMRRHDIVYGEVEGESVSWGEASAAIGKAKELLAAIRKACGIR
jgi:uncharacterized protein (UPF0332 family)